MIWTKDILSAADAFLAAVPLQEKTLSGRIFGDQKKIAILRRGGELTTSRANNALIWLSDNWPNGAIWPDGVERPIPAPETAA